MNGSSRTFFSVAAGQVIASGLQAVFYIVFAAMLKPDQYGEMSYWIALALMFSTIARFGLHYTAEIHQAKKNSTVSNQINTLAAITTIIAAIILIPINWLAAIMSLAFSFFIMSQYNQLGLKQYKTYVYVAIIKSVLVITIPILLYFIIGFSGILLGMAISNFAGSFTFIKNLNIKKISFDSLREHYKSLIHNGGVDMSITLPTVLDKVIIGPLFGFVSVGVYQFNLQILAAVGILPGILHGFLLSEESSGHSHKKINYAIIITSGVFVLITVLAGPYIITNFFPHFAEGIFSLQILSLTAIPLSISAIINAKLQSKESSSIGYAGIIRLVSMIILIVILGKWWGLVGFSLAVLFSVILYTISAYVLFRKRRLVSDKI